MAAAARGACRAFLGVPGVLSDWSPDGTEVTLSLPDNPLADGVELQSSLAAGGRPPHRHPVCVTPCCCALGERRRAAREPPGLLRREADGARYAGRGLHGPRGKGG